MGACVLVVPLAAANGGYFPPAWGWATLVLAWVVAMAIVARSTVVLDRLDVALLAAFGTTCGWIWLSLVWSQSRPASILEGQRTLVYLAGVAALLLVARRSSISALLGGIVAATTITGGQALATRLFPERLGAFDSIAGYRLSEPLGYWNALGIFSVMGILLALGLSVHSGSPLGSALAASSLVVLVPTLYFTFSRGSWVALGVGVAAGIALDPRRLRLVSGLTFVLPAPVLAVWLASRSEALTHQDAIATAASRAGHRLAAVLAVLAVLAAILALAWRLLECRVRFGGRTRRRYGGALMLLASGLVIVAVAYQGGPLRAVESAYRAFRGPPPEIGGDLNDRLFSFSGGGRAETWDAAWRDVEEHPVLGSGAGSYELYWLEHRGVEWKLRDAHSLYFETLAELGGVGLMLLLLALAVPVAAAVRARASPLVSSASAAYVAYVAHAGIDWDWEMPAVTLTGLACGGACVIAARGHERPRPVRPAVRVAVLASTAAIGVVAFVGLVSNIALAESRKALLAGRWDTAEREAKRGARWAPWSAESWQRLGEVQVALSNPRAARASFREALARDPRSWLLWYELAGVATGAERRHAARQVVRLNRLAPEAAEMRQLIAGL